MATRTDMVKEDDLETPITASDVQDRLGDVLDRAFSGERLRVTRHGRDRAYIIGVRDYERLRKLELEAATANAA